MNLFQVKSIIPETIRGKGRLAALGGGILLSFDSVFIRLSGASGVDTAFLFGLFSAVSMAIMIQLTDRRGVIGLLREDGWPTVLSALLILGSASSMILSIKHTTVANTVIIISSRPVLTALVAWIALKEKTSTALWLAIASVIGGISIVVSGSLSSGNLLGDGFALFAVVCLGLNGTLWRRYKEISRLGVVGLAGVFIAAFMFIPAHPSTFSSRTWLVMAVMGLFSAPMGRVLNALSTRYIPAAEMAMFTLLNVVLAPTWAFFIFSEQPPLKTLIGGGVILSTIILYIWTTGRSAQKPEKDRASQEAAGSSCPQLITESTVNGERCTIHSHAR